jgi:hypothetical protein
VSIGGKGLFSWEEEDDDDDDDDDDDETGIERLQERGVSVGLL